MSGRVSGPGRREKADGRTVRMHAPEESDCVVIPMKASNKAERSAAEELEGGRRLTRTSAQHTRHRHRAGTRVPGSAARVQLSPWERGYSRWCRATLTIMPYRATAAVCRRSDVGWHATGKQCCAAVVPTDERTGNEWAGLLSDGFPRFAFSIPTLARALTLCIEGKSRMVQ